MITKLHNLLFYRFVAVNLSGLAALVWAESMGFVSMVFREDSSKISYLIALLFIVVMISTFVRIFKLAHQKNELSKGYPVEIDGIKAIEKTEHISDTVTWLAQIGLIGTCIGFIAMSASVDMDSLGNVAGVKQMAVEMLAGYKIAFLTTLIGAILALWLDINRRMLRTALISFLRDNLSVLNDRVILERRD